MGKWGEREEEMRERQRRRPREGQEAEMAGLYRSEKLRELKALIWKSLE